MGRFSRNQIYYLLLQNSQHHSKTWRKASSYPYEVKNQWQGRLRELKIIGDNHGEGAVLRLDARPRLYQELYKTVKVKRRFIHVIRNPYDNISTISLKTKKHKRNLRESIDYYSSLCKTFMDIKKQMQGVDMFDLRHESFIENPKTCLKELCHFLGVDTSDDYLKDCASIAYKSPHKSRHDTQ